MSHHGRPSRFGDVGQALRAVALSPFRLQTYLNLLYLLLAFPLGILYFVFLITGFSVGVSLLVLLIGAPILVGVLLACHVFASFERFTARYLLSVDIDSPGYPFLEADGLSDRLRSLVLGRETYTSLCYLAAKLVVGIASFVLLTTMFTTAVVMLLTPLYYDHPNVSVGFFNGGDPIHVTPSIRIPWNELLVGAQFAVTITEWEVTTFHEALAVSAVGFCVLTLSFAVLNAFARVLGAFSKLVLGSAPPEPIDGLRARLGR